MKNTTTYLRAVACIRLVRLWVMQRLCSHRFDYGDLVGRPTPDGCVTWPCYKCGKVFVRPCGLDVLHHGQVGNKQSVRSSGS
jgi:hypothetical protein